ncbi:MAG: hypothetical protein A2W01_04230 [Candidatus Solincola sediminis]|nr:MAG: hypothetical protein A2W01_04230 [Candidatus Solincola sediminis]
MKGFRRHIAASIAITCVFLVCAVAIGMGAAPANAPEQLVEPGIVESSMAIVPIESAPADTVVEVPMQAAVADVTTPVSEPSPTVVIPSPDETAVEVPEAAPAAPPEVAPAVAPGPPRNLAGTFTGTTTPYVRLTWSAPSSGSVNHYHIYRIKVGDVIPPNLAPLAETKQRNYDDYAIAADVLYRYWVTAINRQQQESISSNTVDVQTYSTAPPAAPQGVQAFAIDPGVSLDWLPNTEKNLAGYNVYERRNGSWRKLNSSLLKDNHYYYANGVATRTHAVSAVNFSGIQSPYTSVVPKATTPVRYEESDPSISVEGFWALEAYTGPSNGKIRVAGDKGAKLHFKFSGSQVKVIVATYWTCGSANIYLDGVLYSTVNLYSSTTTYNVIRVNVPGIKRGDHLLTMEAAGSGNPGGTYNFINLDYCEVR